MTKLRDFILSLFNMIGICCIFFFKQKTAYEMRISDWSSDVCSSDLLRELGLQRRQAGRHRRGGEEGQTAGQQDRPHPQALARHDGVDTGGIGHGGWRRPGYRLPLARVCVLSSARTRSESRRVGHACVSTGSSRWSPYLSKKN